MTDFVGNLKGQAGRTTPLRISDHESSPGLRTPILQRVARASLLGLVFSFAAHPSAAWSDGPDRYAPARDLMVEDHIVAAGIENPRVIEAMRSTPRHEFVLPTRRRLAYFDMAIPIGFGQTISPPYVVAFMTAQLDPQPTDRVLEIGTGSGYQAAVLSPLVKDVFTIEIVEPLGNRARKTLKRLGYDNVHAKVGDGFAGWPEHAPFDKIIVTCSPENVPRPLVEQLADGGQMIVPVGERFQQTLCRFVKTDNELKREALQATFFVPMTGTAEDQRRIREDPANPKVAHGGFETKLDKSDAPAGWYYARQSRVRQDDSAPEGQHVAEFSSEVPGRSAHALQAISADGSAVRTISVGVSVRGEDIRPGSERNHQAHMIVEFYGANRAPVGHEVLGPWSGTFDWQQETKTIRVPRTARLAVLGIGLFGATGRLDVDNVSVDVGPRP